MKEVQKGQFDSIQSCNTAIIGRDWLRKLIIFHESSPYISDDFWRLEDYPKDLILQNINLQTKTAFQQLIQGGEFGKAKKLADVVIAAEVKKINFLLEKERLDALKINGERYGMVDCKTVFTPIAIEWRGILKKLVLRRFM